MSDLKQDPTIARLKSTGWQSWSDKPIEKSPILFPLFNYQPKKNVSESIFAFPVSKINLKRPIYGWCSWLAHGWEINEQKILRQTQWLFEHKNKIPVEYILIDGGWCLWGDWMVPDKAKFPDLAKLISKIKGKKLKTGIWLAPFLTHKKSIVALSHPDWLVKAKGKPVDGFRFTPWDDFFGYGKFILDIKNPAVEKYIWKSISHLIDIQGFELLKLDFLYALYFDPKLSNAEADDYLRNFLLKIRKRYPKVYVIACGCPLIPAIGVVDSMRVGPDSITSPFLKFAPFSYLIDNFMFGSMLKTLKNRAWTKVLWNIDPDGFICRKSLHLPEKKILGFQNIIRELNGNIFLGDDLTQLSRYELENYIYPLFE